MIIKQTGGGGRIRNWKGGEGEKRVGIKSLVKCDE
jgi:hypothetical protein